MKYVFTTRNLKLLDGKAIRKMISTYTMKAGIDKDITTHSLRHTFSTDLLSYSKNIIKVKEALGYSDISTTQGYTRLVNDELENVMKNLKSNKRK